MKKVLTLVMALVMVISIPSYAEYVFLSEEEAVEYLETALPEERAIFAFYGEDYATVFLKSVKRNIPRNGFNEYRKSDLDKFIAAYPDWIGFERLPNMTARISWNLGQKSSYTVQEILNSFWDGVRVPELNEDGCTFYADGYTFEVYPDEEGYVDRDEFVLQAYYLEAVINYTPEAAIEYLEEALGVEVEFLGDYSDGTIVFAGAYEGEIERMPERFTYTQEALELFVRQYETGELEQLPERTAQLNLELSEEFYTVEEVYKLFGLEAPSEKPEEGTCFYMNGGLALYTDFSGYVERKDIIGEVYRLESTWGGYQPKDGGNGK